MSSRLLFLVIGYMFSIVFLCIGQENNSKGKDFWVSFPPSYHEKVNNHDSLYIVIVADSVAIGTIEYIDKSGKLFLKNFAINNTDLPFEFSIPDEGFELEGINNSGDINIQGRQSDTISLQSFHIITSSPVRAYALNKARFSSEATLLIPTEHLANDYIITSYYTDTQIIDSTGLPDAKSTPSQFVVIATEDSTKVTIIPTAPTTKEGLRIREILLNKGQSYLVQSQLSKENRNSDLTGSQVLSTKPVAVFSGHQRATISVGSGSQYRSRNYLLEQMPPLRTLGREFYLAPFADAGEFRNPGNDLFRVLAAYDSTILSVGGQNMLLMRGKIYEGQLISGIKISTSKPVLTSVIKRSAHVEGAKQFKSDPFMIIVPPREQYLSSLRFTTIQGYSQGGEVFPEQYILITAPQQAQVKLDGKILLQSTFQPIQNSQFAYTNIKVASGIHKVEADSNISILVYGYSTDDAYGTIAGTGMNVIDFTPPEVSIELSKDSCNRFLTATVIERGISDKGVAKLSFIDSLTKNVSITEEPIVTSRILIYQLSVIDPYQDAMFFFRAVDSSGNIKEFGDTLYGFTADFPQVKNTAGVYQFSDVYLGEVKSDSIIIRNYGLSEMRIDKLEMKENTNFSVPLSQFPLVIEPGNEKVLQVFFNPLLLNEIIDTLTLTSGCFARKLPLKGNGIPIIMEGISNCNVKIKLTSSQIPNFFVRSQTNEVVDIEYTLFKESFVELALYDLLGRKVKAILKEQKVPGTYSSFLDISQYGNGTYILSGILKDKNFTKLIHIK